jgi:hypothetical protein
MPRDEDSSGILFGIILDCNLIASVEFDSQVLLEFDSPTDGLPIFIANSIFGLILNPPCSIFLNEQDMIFRDMGIWQLDIAMLGSTNAIEVFLERQ